ncbi:MAG: hypothetical protein JST06_11315 [Bacteroidetes bacterium]|nr:hypothetical protein [Bacteroidota bacterium]MBS1629586.1 hypothetical protein [Bacteroidota bacterium]
MIGLFFLVIFWLALVLFYLYCSWKLFEKAGREGWEGIIPIYNLYVMIRFVGKPGWWLILFIIPFVNFIFLIWTYNMLSKSFGKDEGFTIGLVLLGAIFFPILALGSARYIGPYGDSAAFQSYQQQHSFDLDKGKFSS